MKITTLLARFALTSLMGSLLLACPKTPEPDPLEPMPRVISFRGSLAEVPIGGTLTLSWSVENATEVRIEELSLGTLSGIEGAEGSVEVAVTTNALFVLTARNARGATDSAVVSVQVQGEPSGLLFVSSETSVEADQPVTLAWSAPGANNVTVNAAPGGAIDLAGQTQSGAVVVRPRQTTTYTINAGGRTATVEVRVTGSITRFTATPTVGTAGGTVTLSWATANVDRVQLLAPGRPALVDTTDAARVASGTFDDVLPAMIDPGQLFPYELRVTAGAITLTRQVTVTIAGNPSITTFDAPVAAKRTPGSTITLGWRTVETDRVSISANGVVIYQSPGRAIALSGSTTLPAPQVDTTYELTASDSRGGSVTASRLVDSLGTPTVTLTATPQAVMGGDQITLSWTGQEIRNVAISSSTTGLVVVRQGPLDTGTATVRVNGDAVFTITADNSLGDVATSTASVTATSPVTLSVTPSGDLRLGQNVAVTASRPGPLVGLPHQTVQTRPASTGFLDLTESGTRLVFATTTSSAPINTTFRTVLFGRTVGQAIRVSRHGYLVFGDYLNGSNSIDVALPTTKLEPMAVAPYWESLTFQDVFWEIRAAGGTSTLIVQWNWSTASVQAKISSTGEIEFEYAQLPTTVSGKAGVTGPTVAQSIAAPTPAVGTGFTFFGAMPQPVQVPAFQSGRVSASVEISPGEAVRAEGTLTATLVAPDELGFTEVLSRSVLPNGQWLELSSWSPRAIDLTGWSLSFADGGVAPLTASIPARGTLVLGASLDPALNDDAGVQVAVPGFDLSGATSVALTREGTHQALSLLQTDGGRPATGTSLVLDPGPLRYPTGVTVPQGARTCLSTSPYGVQMPQQLGRPGFDQGCVFPYAKSSIAPGFFDISVVGTGLSFVEDNNGLASLSLTAAPVPFFGDAQTSMVVSINGYLSFDETSVLGTQLFTSTLPATADTNSVVAVFADDLQLNRVTYPDSNVYLKRVGPGEDPFAAAPHWIVQWHRVSHSTTTVASRDDLNFQAKLFDDGVIEYHFAELRSTSSTQYGSGTSSVTWLEAPGGTSALVINANSTSPGISPHTAFRFTPRGSP
ncbi:MAG: hypothetical protein Q8N23_31370 [Archangium sp.]|nr:hypothetical protein [Archangium sp.]MDP3157214.1 hypothetical protein [Archangium sp.]MDP3576274.1 hypothetical protein [Archangium sp.]